MSDQGESTCGESSNENMWSDDKEEDSATEVEDNEEGPTHSEKEMVDPSSDESLKAEPCDITSTSKTEKKSDKSCKPKVKIKTLTIDGQLVYFCKICDKIFTRRKDKLNHELAHSGESVLTCTECGKEYLHESSLASHMRTHDGDPLYMCDLCPKMFAQSHHLKTHILSHSEPTNFTCKTCYKEFATSSDLKHHNRVQIKQEITQYWCKMCKVYFCRNHELTCKRRLHAFCCSACNELFYTHKKLKIHMKKYAHFSVEKPKYIEPLQEHELYPDKVPESLKKIQAQKENDILKKPLKSKMQNKRQHDDNAENEVPSKKFKLSPRKVFVDGDQSSTSVQDSAPEIGKEFQMEIKSPSKQRKGKPYCKKCNKSFKDATELDRHKTLVHEEKKDLFTCEVCNAGFSTKDELERHSFKHTGERMHTCPMCGEEFPHSLQLTKHLKTHVGDFPYKCSQCGKAFRLKIQLIQHVRIHIAQDANACEKCPAKFSTRPELQDHLLNFHGQTESFKCHLCSKTFSFRYKLMNHLRLHTNVKCFQCYICHKTFATKHYLQRHLQVHIKQGMDVDVQNIIVDEDSKSELESVREQMTNDSCKAKEGFHHRQSLDSFERESSKKNFPSIKRSISNIEMGNKYRSSSSNNMDHNLLDCDSNENIKVEIPDDSDSISEHSFCSSFTRDSERSDPFKYSSDDSYSFKTAMAKERRRLRRRWRKNRGLYLDKTLQPADDMTKSLNEGTLCHEDADSQEEEPVDMVVELNGVRDEEDNTTTVYVNLTQMESVPVVKLEESVVTEQEISLTDKNNTYHSLGSLSNPAMLKLEQDVKIEMEDSCKGDLLKNLTAEDIENISKIEVSRVKDGKVTMLEIDAEKLLNGDFKMFENIDTNSTDDQTKVETSISDDSISRHHAVSQSSQESHHKQRKTLTPESSNLERLKAAFETSSKYLPLSQSEIISPHQSCSHPDQNKLDNHKPSETASVNTGSVSQSDYHHVNTPCRDEKSASCIGRADEKKVSTLPLPNKHSTDTASSIEKQKENQITNAALVSSKRQEILADHKPSHDPVKLKTSSAQSNEKPERKVSALSVDSNRTSSLSQGMAQRGREKHQSQNRVLLPATPIQSSSASVQQNLSHGISSSSHPSHSSTISSASVRASHNTQVSGQTQISGLVQPGINSVPGNTDSGQRLTNPLIYPNLNSGMSLQPSGPAMSSLVNPAHNNLCGAGDTVQQGVNMGSSFNPVLKISGNLATNPTGNPCDSVSLHLAATQNISSMVPQGPNLNPSSIFDTNNPMYRDMNMMDLVGSSSAGNMGNLPTAANFDMLRMESLESQMRRNALAIAEAQNAALQPPNPNPVFRLEVPTLGSGFSSLGNPLNNSLNTPLNSALTNPMNAALHSVNQGLIGSNPPINYIPSGSSALNLDPFGRGGVNDVTGDVLMHMRSTCNTTSRGNFLMANAGAIPQQMPSNMGLLANSLSVSAGGNFPPNSGGNFSLNTNNFGGLGYLTSGTLGPQIPTSIANFGNPAMTGNNLPPFNTSNIPCGLPTNIAANPHLMNNLGNNLAPFSLPLSGMQDDFRNLMAPPAVNILNPSMVPPNYGTLSGIPGNTFGVMNSLNPGFFPNF